MVMAVKKLLKKWIHIVSVFIANIPTHLLRTELLATLLQLNSKDHIQVQEEKVKFVMACFIFDKMWNETFSLCNHVVKATKCQKKYCTCRAVLSLKPMALLKFSLPSPWSDLKVSIFLAQASNSNSQALHCGRMARVC